MILLTGATGFIGAAVYKEITRLGFQVRPVVRNKNNKFGDLSFFVESFNSNVNWSMALDNIDVIIHCAAQAHNNNLNVDEVNTRATVALAKSAALKGVRRFIYISTIGVNGNQTFGTPFMPDDEVDPKDSYALSKFRAEKGLMEISRTTGLEAVIIRPPLVYGPGAPGNFSRLVEAIRTGRWLPLGAINNQRTLVALDNLVNLIVTCINHPRARDEIFLAGDAEDISTTNLLKRIGFEIGKPAKLLPVPIALMHAGAKIIGKTELIEKICGDLQVDTSKNYDLLGWKPPISLQEGLRRLAMEKI